MAENAIEEAYKALMHGVDIAIARIDETSGSSPRHTGALMTVDARGNRFGTVGGGLLEAKAIEACEEALRTHERSKVHHFVLNDRKESDLGTICGGEADILVEWYSADHPEELQIEKPVAPRAIIVGAGHCGTALEPVLRHIGFDVTMVDDRAEYANSQRFPESEIRVIDNYDNALEGVEGGDDVYVIIVTRGHMGDYETVRSALKLPLAYIGMIGSRKKVARIFGKLKDEDGFTDEDIAKVFAPVGVDIAAETPAEIAISIAAQIIQIKNGQAEA